MCYNKQHQKILMHIKVGKPLLEYTKFSGKCDMKKNLCINSMYIFRGNITWKGLYLYREIHIFMSGIFYHFISGF